MGVNNKARNKGNNATSCVRGNRSFDIAVFREKDPQINIYHGSCNGSIC